MYRQRYGFQKISAITIICLIAAVIAPAKATTVIPVSDDDMVRQASLIVEGVVTKIESAWNKDRTQIHTFIDINVRKQIKGALPKNQTTIHLRVLGGTVDDITMHVVDAPSFKVDEEMLLFLRPNYDVQLFPVVGFNQGKIHIDTDPNTGTKSLKGRKPSLDEFEAELVRKVREQAPKSEPENTNHGKGEE